MTHKENDSRPIEAQYGTVGWSPDYQTPEDRRWWFDEWLEGLMELQDFNAREHSEIAEMYAWLLDEARWWAEKEKDCTHHEPDFLFPWQTQETNSTNSTGRNQ